MNFPAKALQIALGASDKNISLFGNPIAFAMAMFQIDANKNRAAMFLAQVAHESGCLTEIEENMNYSADRLLEIFPKHFTSDADALAYANKPDKIGARVYASRMGNGDEASGDGYRYRGRGLIQMTGKDDYAACGKALQVDLINKPEILATPHFAALSAAWEWNRSKLNAVADAGNFEECTKIINGGLIGEPERLIRWDIAKKALS